MRKVIFDSSVLIGKEKHYTDGGMSNIFDLCSILPTPEGQSSAGSCFLLMVNFYPAAISLIYFIIGVVTKDGSSIIAWAIGLGGVADLFLNYGLQNLFKVRITPNAAMYQFFEAPYGLPAYASQCLCYYTTILSLFWVKYHRTPSFYVTAVLSGMLSLAMFSRIHFNLSTPEDLIVGAGVGVAEACVYFTLMELFFFPFFRIMARTRIGAAFGIRDKYLYVREVADSDAEIQEIHEIAFNMGLENNIPAAIEEMRYLVEFYNKIIDGVDDIGRDDEYVDKKKP